MFDSLRHYFRSGHPLADRNLSSRARDVTFRVMEDADITTCMGFYRAYEGTRFPLGRYEEVEASLRKRTFLPLLAMREGDVVGCCGFNYQTSMDGVRLGVLSFGMVNPAHQRQGVGTAQVLARLALLEAVNDLALAAMAVVPQSLSFYRRFGFVFDREIVTTDGTLRPMGILRASQTFIDDCRAVMKERRIICPDVRSQIPMATVDKWLGPAQ